MYDLGCMLAVNQDPSWYSTNYRVYMGSSMIVGPLADCHCTCALINWSVLLQFMSQKFASKHDQRVVTIDKGGYCISVAGNNISTN